MRIYKDKITVSPSSLTSFYNCSLDHSLRYRHGLKSMGSMNFSRGTGYHAGIEHYFRNRLILEDYAHDAKWEFSYIKTAAMKLRDERKEAEKHPVVKFDKEEFKQWCQGYVLGIPAYIKTIGQYIDPIMVEEEIKVQVGTFKGKPVFIHGYMDVVGTINTDLPQFDLAKGDIIVADHKTGARKGLYVSNEIQLKIYQTALKLMGKTAKLQIHKLNLKKPTRTRKNVEVDIEVINVPSNDPSDWVVGLIMNAVEQFDKCVEIPSGMTGTFGCSGCSNRFNCDFYGG